MTSNMPTIGFLVPRHGPARDAEKEYFISAALYQPGSIIGYYVSQRLAELYPRRTILSTYDGDFDVDAYARAGHCTLTPQEHPHAEWLFSWERDERRIQRDGHNVWFDVDWQGERLDVLVLHWDETRRLFLLGDDAAVVERFFQEVCAWCAEPHGEVMVFEHGYWQKSEALFRAIADASFDSLVLREGLKAEIIADVDGFFGARSRYELFGVPWKRGVLLTGPPGNGKTHAIKALVNKAGRPCLYVKSFRNAHGPDEDAMHSVFAQARTSAPCILVLEDLDALITPANRSFFLNEMDGFAANVGVLTVATSNHPEALDPAIVRRPSRFDRTYRFDLPALAERAAYVEQWAATWHDQMRLSAATIARVAAATESFSFAYLKELMVSAMMRWLDSADGCPMDTIIATQAAILREQMAAMTPSGQEMSNC